MEFQSNRSNIFTLFLPKSSNIKKSLLQPFRAQELILLHTKVASIFNLDQKVHVFEKKFGKKAFLSFLLREALKQAFKNSISTVNSTKISFFSKN